MFSVTWFIPGFFLLRVLKCLTVTVFYFIQRELHSLNNDISFSAGWHQQWGPQKVIFSTDRIATLVWLSILYDVCTMRKHKNVAPLLNNTWLYFYGFKFVVFNWWKKQFWILGNTWQYFQALLFVTILWGRTNGWKPEMLEIPYSIQDNTSPTKTMTQLWTSVISKLRV